MSLEKEVKKNIIVEWAGDERLSGSSEAQIGLLTVRISEITQHLAKNKHDFSSRRGLFKLISRRKKLLRYVGHTNSSLAKQLVSKIKG